MAKVSIVIPTFNQARYLPICLDAVWFQDYPEIEIVVVDDGSPDATQEALDRFEAAVAGERVSFASRYDALERRIERTWIPRYPGEGRSLVRLRHAVNQGLSATLNTGMRAATGEYVSFIASDDCLLPSMVTELAAALRERDADFAYADMHVVDDEGRILRRFALPDYSFEASFCQWYLCGVCKLYKRSLHEAHGYYSEEFMAQDHEMYLRFAMGGARFTHLRRALANVRIHDRDRKVGNHTQENETRQHRDSILLVERARRFLRDGGPEAAARTRASR